MTTKQPRWEGNEFTQGKQVNLNKSNQLVLQFIHSNKLSVLISNSDSIKFIHLYRFVLWKVTQSEDTLNLKFVLMAVWDFG